MTILENYDSVIMLEPDIKLIKEVIRMKKRDDKFFNFNSEDGALFHVYSSDDMRSPKQKSHQHVLLEILLIRGGRAKFIMDDKTIEAEEGDLLFFRSMEAHWVVPERAKSPLKSTAISFTLRTLLGEYSEWVDNRVFEVFIKMSEEYGNKLNKNEENAAFMKDIIVEMDKEAFHKEKPNLFFLKAKFMELLSKVAEIHREEENTHRLLKNKHSKAIDDVVIYVQKNFANDIRLKDIAKVAHMGETYFSSIFKKAMGLSPWKYVLYTRIEMAIKYLRENNDEYLIADISNKCGFHNTVDFNKMFKQVTGMTPSEYKKINRKSHYEQE